MFLINYLFSSSVTFRRDYFIQFNRIAILALQYSITLHIISLLMCSGDISKGKFINRACSLIFNKFFSFYFFISIFFTISMFSPVKVLISNSYFYKFIIYNLSKIYINYDDLGIYFLFGIFVSCFIILGLKSFYGKDKLILIFGWIVAVLWSYSMLLMFAKCIPYKSWGLLRWRTFYPVKYARKRFNYPCKCISRFQFFRSLTHLLAELVIILRSQRSVVLYRIFSLILIESLVLLMARGASPFLSEKTIE